MESVPFTYMYTGYGSEKLGFSPSMPIAIVVQLIVVTSVALPPRALDWDQSATLSAKCTLQFKKSHADHIFNLYPYRASAASEFNKHK